MISKTYSDMMKGMLGCYQFENVNMYDHGMMVHNAYKKLIAQLEGGEQFIDLPPCIYNIYVETKHLLVDNSDLFMYQVFHDCGKPGCLEIGEDGKRHYPNHSEWSKLQYIQVFGENGTVPELIGMDMDFHTKSGNDLTDLWKSPLAPTLYFTAWAEIIANSSMFGGFDSTSFKIKKKKLIKAAKCMAL